MTNENVNHSLEGTTDKPIKGRSGGGMLVVIFVFLFVAVFLFFLSGANDYYWGYGFIALTIILGVVLLLLVCIFPFGFYVINPNEARVLVLFGKYKGTVKKNGFYWTHPFMSKKKMSLRIRNYDGDKLKVNDKEGNPVEISAVVVWKVEDAARALFDVDNYETYVKIQNESALRGLASQYPYDSGSQDIPSLRGDTAELMDKLKATIKERLSEVGVEVIEARLNHLAYAPEIAAAMLQRQQAEAVIAARQKIVDGAVGMVEMALKELANRNIVNLDAVQKSSLVSNLLVVLCADQPPQPVVNLSDKG